jgi:signal transduction histidine kinase
MLRGSATRWRRRRWCRDHRVTACHSRHPRPGQRGTAPAVGVGLPGAGPWVYVRVEDTGPGIREEQLAAIFDPVMQVGPPGDRGAGLGLTISRRLAQGMGGEITVESAVGVGSAFVVWLPEAPLESLRTGGGA